MEERRKKVYLAKTARLPGYLTKTSYWTDLPMYLPTAREGLELELELEVEN